MSSKKIFSVSLIALLAVASFSFATFNVEASEGDYYLILTSSEGGSIHVEGDELDDPFYETYDDGTEVDIEAEPDENYVFEEWTGDTEGIEDTEDRFTTITIEDEYNITAVFEEDHYELSIDVEGEGEILQPDGEGDHEIRREEEIVIEAKAHEHYKFIRWTGDNETISRPSSNITTIKMEDDYDITAEFEKEIYELSLDVDGEGQILRPGEGDFEYEYDEKIVLEADPNDYHKFVGWTGDTENIENPTSELTTINMEDDYEITAEFEEDYYELSIDSDENGEVIRPGEGDFVFDRGEEVVIEAEAHENYDFDRWTGDTEGIKEPSSDLTTMIMDDDYEITAEFEKEKYELTVDVDGEGEIIRPDEDTSTHEHGAEVILEVEAEDGYKFTGWSGDTGSIDNPDSTLAVIEITDDHDITAEFESEEFELKNEWIVIAVLLVIIAFLIIQRFTSSTEESEESELKEGVCENCSEIIPADSRECPECGTPLIPQHLPEMRKASESE